MTKATTNGSLESPPTRNIGPSIRICQINVEGISRAKSEYLSRLLLDNKVDVLTVQETHTESEEQFSRRGHIPGYTALGATYHHTYGVATYIRNNIDHAQIVTCKSDNDIHTVSIKVEDITIINVYKPPATIWPEIALPIQQHPAVYIGDFNSHHERWKYTDCDINGTKLNDWAENNDLHLVFDAKDRGTFRSAAWGREYNPDLCFVSCNASGGPLHSTRKVLENFPHSQHRPVLLDIGIQIPLITSIPRPRWNFGKADWQKYSLELEKLIRWFKPTTDNYRRFVGAVISAAKRSIPRGFRKEYIPGWDERCALLYHEFQETSDPETAEELLASLNNARKSRWIKTVTDMNFQHSSRKSWSLLRKLGTSTPPTKVEPKVTADQIANHIVETSRVPCNREHTKHIKQQVTELKKNIPHASMYSRPFSVEEVNEAIHALASGKAPGFDGIHPEFLIHAGPKAKKWLAQFYTCLLETGNLPPDFKRSKIISILKPGKPSDRPESYRPIALLSCCSKLLERLIYNRICGPVLEQVPVTQAGFRPNRSCSDQVMSLTTFIEAGYQDKLKTGVAFIDLTAAFDTVWREGLLFKLQKVIPCQTTARLINNMLCDRKFQVILNETTSRERKLKNGLPQGSVLAPLLFNLYLSDIPETISKKFCYADDIAIATSHRDFGEIENVLTSDLGVLHEYFRKWRLIPSANKTEVSCFHLLNRSANYQLQVSFANVPLRHNHFPKYLGVTLDRTLSFKKHLTNTAGKIRTRNNLIQKLCGTTWGSTAHILRTSSLALVYSCAEYCAPAWLNSRHTKLLDVQLNQTMRMITGTIKSTPIQWLPVLSGIAPPDLRRNDALMREYKRISANPQLPIHQARIPLRRGRLKSRRPPIREAEALSLNNYNAVEQWRNRWNTFALPHVQSAFAGGTLPPGSDLPRRDWVRLNRVRTCHGRVADSLHKWGLVQTPSCNCGAPKQTIEHIVRDCALRAYQGEWNDFLEATPAALDWIRQLDINL